MGPTLAPRRGVRLHPPPWDVGYVCRPLDPASPRSATQVRWVRRLADEPRVRRVHVIANGCAEDLQLPENVTVSTFDVDRAHPSRLARSFARAVRAVGPVDFYLVVQGGPYPALLSPVRAWTRRPVYQWKAHPVVTARMRFYARWCDDLVFTASPSSFPLPVDHRRVIGHGIDVDFYRPMDVPRDRQLLVFGRVSPIKRIEEAIELVAEAGTSGRPWTLDIVGAGPAAHIERLRARAAARGVDARVRLLGAVAPTDVPAVVGRYQLALSFSGGAVDKAAVEAMACGVPVMTDNDPLLETLPPDLAARLRLPERRRDQVTAVHELLTSSVDASEDLRARCRDAVVHEHGLQRFFSRLLDRVDAHAATLGGRG